MRKILSILLVVLPLLSQAQFAPAQDQPGTTAMHADSSAFIGWATGCTVEEGPMNIANPSLGLAGSSQFVPENAIGVPDGTYGVVCLGDGGYATLTFASPICNREGPDFAVFENGFKSGTQWFLEIAFVEVSSDGEHFFRFPAITNVPYETQLGGFATMDPAMIHNFAGKYGAFYGTPFDLDDVPDNPLLDKENVAYVRVVDVIGCIDPQYATYDSQGHPVNDPWPTPFASSGFDLDAVGVIHDIEHFPTPPPPVAVDATISPSDVLFWIGQGRNKAVFIVNWNDPDTALAWGYRFSSDEVMLKDMMIDIQAADPRFGFQGDSYVTDITFNDGTLDLHLAGMYWMTIKNGEMCQNYYDNEPIHHGDYVKWGDESCGTLIDPENFIYVWEKEIAPVSVYEGVEENNGTILSLYPNPADSYTMLQVATDATVTVADLQGRVVNTFTVNGNEPVRIETAAYKAGFYFVTVSNNVSRQTTKLFVK